MFSYQNFAGYYSLYYLSLECPYTNANDFYNIMLSIISISILLKQAV